ncbi:MAG TPA: DUF5343 domain-containing protein [Bacteroidia bacterium]
MAIETPPYVGATGILNSVLKKIIEAQPPTRFTQDFLTTKLGFKKGSGNAIIPFLKRLGFLGSDGIPTELYNKFRNSSKAGIAMAQGMKMGYSELYTRNEYWHDLDKKELEGLIIEATGTAKNSSTLKQITGTIDVLKQYAKFDEVEETNNTEKEENKTTPKTNDETLDPHHKKAKEELGINLSYTINLNLPETSDIAVFDAIFKSLKENLLKK